MIKAAEVISMQQIGECKYLQMYFLWGEGDCWAVISMDQFKTLCEGRMESDIQSFYYNALRFYM